MTDGVERALELAQEAAGGALPAGRRRPPARPLGPGPIDLEQLSVIESEGVTHLRYRVVR